MKSENKNIQTLAVHAGEKPMVSGAVTLPIFQSSTFEYTGESDYHAIRYIRLNNTPNHTNLAEKLAALEGTEAALVAGSGMAAITASLLALVGVGQHVLAQEGLYGGSHHFLADNFEKLGRQYDFFPVDKLDELERLIRPETKAIYVESISNPTLRIPDLKRIVEFAKKRNLISFIDNTFLSPAFFRPAEMGFDVVLHSATKYLNGHSDIVAGCVAGTKKNVAEINRWLGILGGTLDPHACFLLNRGMKTLGLRMKRHDENAKKLATALTKHPRISKVLHPCLPEHPDFEKAKQYFSGLGGTFSFVYNGEVEALEKKLRRLKFAVYAPSLGGVETLVSRPAALSHSGVPKADRERYGIVDTLVRVSVGLEEAEDLISDFMENL